MSHYDQLLADGNALITAEADMPSVDLSRLDRELKNNSAKIDKTKSRMAERLSGTDDGQPKVFRDSAVNNLLEFLQRFKRLNIRSDDDLERRVTP